ncbi:THEGL [Branchiostoma lanceolatum]|uniref:THEGL protein n=1 Tax=Branchiostoma lanceolatum TaxID=7740 RepID=A0A8J9ZPI5_BRALA|nr:THEGL [Branchiostoma lanceolatum]
MTAVQGPLFTDSGGGGDETSTNEQATMLQRVYQLASPKTSRSVWLTNYEPKLIWGNQDHMWPLSPTALKAPASPRLERLALSKRNFQTGRKICRPEFSYSCGRASLIWEVSPLAMTAESTERVRVLAHPKKPPPEYQKDRPENEFSCGRVSPIWTVADGAKRCPSRDRSDQLARAKTPHQHYTGNKEVETLVPRPAQLAVATPRVEDLARPKSRPAGLFLDPGHPEQSIWKVNGKARTVSATQRLLELSKPKGLADGFVNNREVAWPVSRSARRNQPTERLGQLSIPIIRATMDHVQFDPDAFLVKETAKKARCSQRVEELAQPLVR